MYDCFQQNLSDITSLQINAFFPPRLPASQNGPCLLSQIIKGTQNKEREFGMP